mmetsp:Transcript_37447/g.119147  ORF Transcript_37447/g.119147 Transcript_37447/m.119147 type:complete len:222 (-) Transcript_37447:1614-2279(-)
MGREVRSGHWSHGSPRVDDLHREAGLQLQDPERLRGGPPQRHDPWLGLLRAPAEEVPAPDSLCRGGLQRHQACSAVGSRGPDRLRDVRALRPGRRPRLARTGEQDVEAADGAVGLPRVVRPPVGGQPQAGLPRGVGHLAQEGRGHRAHPARSGPLRHHAPHHLPTQRGGDADHRQAHRSGEDVQPHRQAHGRQGRSFRGDHQRPLPLPGGVLQPAHHRLPG